MDPSAVRTLEEEGWRVDWGSDVLADALAEREEDAQQAAGGRQKPQGGAAAAASALRSVLLDLDLRKVGSIAKGWGCCYCSR